MWHKITINYNNILKDFDNYTIIKMPKNSHYKDYTFCLSNKLIKYKQGTIELSINDDMNFKLKKNNIEKVIDCDELMNAFDVINNNLQSSSYLIIKEPTKINKEVKILEELKNE